MDTRTCGVAFGNTQRPVGLADEKIAAAHPATRQESLVAIGFDELQAMQRGGVAHRNDERTVVKADPVRLDTFRDQIRMIFGCILRSLPFEPGFLAGFGFMLVLLSFALPPLGIHACPMGSFFLRKRRASDVCPPLLMHTAAPVSESTGGNPV